MATGEVSSTDLLVLWKNQISGGMQQRAVSMMLKMRLLLVYGM